MQEFIVIHVSLVEIYVYYDNIILYKLYIFITKYLINDMYE